MNPAIPYILQRQALRMRLQAQRLLIAQELSTNTLIGQDDEFPRSLTMRLLTRMPGVASFLLTDLAPLLVSRFLGGSRSKSLRR